MRTSPAVLAPIELKRRSVLVTGASRGLGRAIAQQLAARGMRVAVHFQKNRTAAKATQATLLGAGHALFAADLGDAGQLEGLWHEVIAAFGQVDVLVNNAGIYELHSPLTTTPAAWRAVWERTLAANLLGPAQLSLFAAQALAERGGGRIVNISSRGAFRGEGNAPAYGAAKAGLNALGQSLAKVLAPHRVYVYGVAPGWMETDMAAPHLHGPRRTEILADQPLGRVATTDEVARVAVFCALDAPAAMTGAIIDVNGASYLRT
jgi:NAD(P)-dependent dehydrogenase (short-subunit alcohol dehydrogenase family)